MGADCACGAYDKTSDEQRCELTLVPLGPPANIWSGVVVILGAVRRCCPGRKLFIHRYSGRDPSFLGLVIVIGPVDGVEKWHRRRLQGRRPVHLWWTDPEDNRACLWTNHGCPQAGLDEAVVIHRLRVVVAQVVPRESTGTGGEGTGHMSTELSPGCGQIEVSGWRPAGYRWVAPTPPVWTTLWMPLSMPLWMPPWARDWATMLDQPVAGYRDWLRIRLVSSVTWL